MKKSIKLKQQALLEQYGPRESMEYDVVVVGAGPSGLACAIRLKQLSLNHGAEISVAVLEKGSEPGAHILSGAIIDPKALNELIPEWQEKGAPLKQEVTSDIFLFLGKKKSIQVPNFLLPACFKNHGNYIVRLGYLVKWLAEQAEGLGVEIFPGFAATEILYSEAGSVKGVSTGNLGLDKNGEPTKDFQLGMGLHAKYTIFAEGARGHLGCELIKQFRLDEGKDPPSFGLGIKELWDIDPQLHHPGLVLHSAGWPLENDTYGGAFLYHLENNQISLGFITGLNYTNPYLSPFEEMQRWKTHPDIRKYLEGDVSKGISSGKRLAYGARAINAGGLQSLPKTVFPGGALIGCDAGYLNVSRIKGSHAAIKTGMLVADAIFEAVQNSRQHDELVAYPQAFRESWLYDELYKSRNFKNWFKKGLFVATLMNGFEQFVLRGKMPWTLHRVLPDHDLLMDVKHCKPIDYPKPDGKLTFDRLSSVFLSNTNHSENQPAHLILKDASVPVNINLKKYDGLEERYCPAGVYEFVSDNQKNGDICNTKRLQINAQNCVHCKTCDIKDPTQNIIWTAPEGGGGPNYVGM